MATNNKMQVLSPLEQPDKKQPEPVSRFEPLLDVNEAASLLRIHPKTLLKKARSREIPAIQVGKLWRFRASALNEWLEKLAS